MTNPIITVCGDDCSVCPRYLAKTEEELKKVAEFWYLVGWRDRVVSPEEIQCQGCSIHNNCRYHILACTIEHNVVKCKECPEYSCDKIQDMLKQSDEMEAQCKRYLSECEFEQFKRAFYEKRKNLEL